MTTTINLHKDHLSFLVSQTIKTALYYPMSLFFPSCILCCMLEKEFEVTRVCKLTGNWQTYSCLWTEISVFSLPRTPLPIASKYLSNFREFFSQKKIFSVLNAVFLTFLSMCVVHVNKLSCDSTPSEWILQAVSLFHKHTRVPKSMGQIEICNQKETGCRSSLAGGIRWYWKCPFYGA